MDDALPISSSTYDGRLLCISGAFPHVDDIFHENERCDSMGDGGRRGSMSQEISHSYFQNYGESVDGDGRSLNRYQTSPSPYHHSGELGRSLFLIVMLMPELYISIRPSNLIHITMMDYTLITQGSLNNISQGTYKEKYKSNSYL